MFAHQVIEDAKRWGHDKLIPGVYDTIMKDIRDSQKFHLGDSCDLSKMFKRGIEEKRPIFSTDTQYLKLPYKMCWFDYLNDDNGFVWKRGSLVAEVNADIHLITFIWDSDLGWLLVPCGVTVNVSNENKQKLAGDYIKIWPLIKKDLSGMREDIIDDIAVDLSILEYSLMVLNCKNIQTGKIYAPEALNKKRRKTGKQELFNYHVLNVVMPSNNKRGYQEQSVPLSHNRVHLCRGHFKEYTAEHPLFGKYTGLWWWQPAVRGQNKDGIVMKDYNVVPNINETTLQ